MVLVVLAMQIDPAPTLAVQLLSIVGYVMTPSSLVILLPR